MKTMKALLIDPERREVREIRYSGKFEGGLGMNHYLRLPGQSGSVDHCRLNGEDFVTVDDNELTGDLEQQQFFVLFDRDGGGRLLAGRAVVTGVDSAGDEAPPLVSLAELCELVKWPDQEWARGEAERMLAQSGIFTVEDVDVGPGVDRGERLPPAAEAARLIEVYGSDKAPGVAMASGVFLTNQADADYWRKVRDEIRRVLARPLVPRKG